MESRPIGLYLAGESRMVAARQQSAGLFLEVLRPPWKDGQPSAGGWKQTAPRRLSRRRFLVSLSRAASEAGTNGGPAIRRGPDIRALAGRRSRRRPPKGGSPHFSY
ncbi:Tat pathway signal sequence domain protein [Acetobacteraceae bacterium AT-5844]|nr:Tat pathway signal sequence domain protein [Acetobacteraceae bacterium AT-5844]